MILFYILILSLPLMEQRVLSSNIGGITVEKYLGAACLLYAFFYLAAKRSIPNFFQTIQARAFLLFYAVASFSYFTLGNRTQGKNMGGMMVIYTSHLIFLLTTVALVDSLKRLRWALLAAIGSMGLASLYVLREWQKASVLYGMDYRPGFVTGDANYYTASVILCVPLACRFIVRRGNLSERFYCLVCLLLTLAGIMVAASRGGFLGLVASALYLVWHSRHRFRSFFVVGVMILCFILVSPNSPLERFWHPHYGDVVATNLRLELWQASLKMIWEHPVTGVGLGNFQATVGAYGAPGEALQNMAHNTYLEMAAEMGLPGLSMFLVLLLVTFFSLRRIACETSQRQGSLLHDTALSIQEGLLGFAVASSFISAEFLKLFWFMVFLSMALPALAKAAEASNSPQVVRTASHAAFLQGTNWRGSEYPRLR